jgi:hypothetical protein
LKQALTAFAFCLVGCGGTPSSYDLCNDACGYESRCLSASQAMVDDCNVNCQSRKQALDAQDQQYQMNCKNYSTVENLAASCYGRACSEVPGCLASIDSSCVAK